MAIATQSVLFPDLFEERPLTSLRASFLTKEHHEGIRMRKTL